MPECNLCQDTNFTTALDGTLIQCRCQLRKEVKNFLPQMFDKLPIVKKGFDYKQFDKNLVYKTNLNKFGTFIKTLLTYKYLKDRSFTYEIVTAHVFVEQFFEETSNQYYSTDLLILMVYGGYKNQRSINKLSTLIKDRALTNKNTVIFIDSPDFTESKLKDWYGDDFLSSIKQFSTIS